MRSWAKWTATTVVFATGFAVAGGGLAGVALAGTGTTSSGNVAAASGNLIDIPVSIPVNVCGNAAAILGVAAASCQGGATVASRGTVAAGTHGSGIGNISAVGRNFIFIPVQAAIDACGNAVGNATAHCPGGVSLPGGGVLPARLPAGRRVGNVGVASGNIIDIPVSVPVNICGNAVAVLGDSTAGCAGGASVGIVPQSVPAVCPAKKPATHKSKHSKIVRPRIHGKAPAGGPHPLTPVRLASVGALPGLSGLAGLVQPILPGTPLLGGQSLLGGQAPLARTKHNDVTQMPASTLSAMQASVAGRPLSGNSLAALAVGALLAGAAALKVAGIGRNRKSVSDEVSA
jgi:hypothetical protein